MSRRRARQRSLAPGAKVWSASLLLLAFTTLPIVAILLRVPVADIVANLAEPEVRSAALLSFWTSLVATLLSAAFGLPVALILARGDPRGNTVLQLLVDLPMTLPPVVAGLGLLMAFGREGMIGEPLRALGINLPFTTTAVILAQTFVAAPLFIRSAQAGLERVDEELEDAAALLGANRWTIFWRVAVPLAWPAVLAGLVLAWARAMSEFGATLLFAGSYLGRTRTLPLALYGELESNRLDLALTLAVISLTAAAVALVAVRLTLRRLDYLAD